MAIMSAGAAATAAMLQEMQRDPRIVYGQSNGVDGRLLEAFGPGRVVMFGIDEFAVNGFVHGAAIAGNPAIASVSNMCPAYYFTYLWDIGSSIRYASGGAASAPMVLIQGGSSRGPGRAANHAIVGQEAWYSAMPGVKVVIPSDAYNTKGLLTAAIRDPDPVMFITYQGAPAADVPDGDYVLPIGEPSIRQTGSDVTIVAFHPAIQEVEAALPDLAASGISVEVIDPLTLTPLNYVPIVESVAKTGRLLTVDHGYHRFGYGTQITAMVAEALGPRASYKRLGFPDAHAPGAKEMIESMTPVAKDVVDAVNLLLG